MNPYEEWILLDIIPHLGAKKCRELIEHFGSPQKVLAASLKELSAIPGLNKEAITCLNKKTSKIHKGRLKTSGGAQWTYSSLS